MRLTQPNSPTNDLVDKQAKEIRDLKKQVETLRLARQIDADDVKAERAEWAMKQANLEGELQEMRAHSVHNAPEYEEDPRIKQGLVDDFVKLNDSLAQVCSEIAQSISHHFDPKHSMTSSCWEGKVGLDAGGLIKSPVRGGARPMLEFVTLLYLRHSIARSLAKGSVDANFTIDGDSSHDVHTIYHSLIRTGSSTFSEYE